MRDQLSSASFIPLIGQRFRVYPGPWDQPYDTEQHPAPLDLVLSEVRDLGSAASTPTTRSSFSLLFHQPETLLLPQRIYSVEHDTLGQLAIFLVPIGPDSDGMRYQAIFN